MINFTPAQGANIYGGDPNMGAPTMNSVDQNATEGIPTHVVDNKLDDLIAELKENHPTYKNPEPPKKDFTGLHDEQFDLESWRKDYMEKHPKPNIEAPFSREEYETHKESYEKLTRQYNMCKNNFAKQQFILQWGDIYEDVKKAVEQYENYLKQVEEENAKWQDTYDKDEEFAKADWKRQHDEKRGEIANKIAIEDMENAGLNLNLIGYSGGAAPMADMVRTPIDNKARKRIDEKEKRRLERELEELKLRWQAGENVKDRMVKVASALAVATGATVSSLLRKK